jgi:DNA-binding CsgD family transcriptional regulator
MNLLNSSQLLSQMLGLQKEIYAQEADKIVTVKDSYINEFSNNDNSVRLIFDHVNFKIVHVSTNVEVLTGYTVNDFHKLDIGFFLKLFELEHASFALIWLKWAFSIQQKMGTSFDAKQAMCGVKAVRKDGQMIRVLFRQSALESNEQGTVTVSAFTIDDITHLMKADFYWGRIECGVGQRHFHHLLSTDKQDKPTDILSDREKEMVRLLAQGKESKEIGSIVYISPHTVDNHRRNMINKVGVRDTTGLIQICRMIGVIRT